MAHYGFVDWKPTGESETILRAVLQVFDEYHDYLPLTGRQIFYRLVGAYGYPKSERAANKLYGILGRARRAGMIPFSHLRDGGGQKSIPLTYADEDAFWKKVRKDAEFYSRNRQKGQGVYVELFCEAPGMMPQLQRAAFPYSVPVYGTRGYTGLAVVGEVARRALNRDVPTTILQVGDLDPSGIGIFDTLSRDVTAFVEQTVHALQISERHVSIAQILGVTEKRAMEISDGTAGTRSPHGSPPAIGFERIALTWDQVHEHDLPTAPPSSKDSRTVNWPYDDTAQAEALPPDLLQQIVRESIEEQFNMRVYRAECDREEADEDAIEEKFNEVGV